MITRIFRPIRDGFKGFFRHFSVVLSSVAVVSFTMIFLGAILLLTANIHTMSSTLESEIDLWFSIKPEYDDKLVEIEKQLNEMPEIATVQLLTKEAELELYIEQHGAQYEIYRGNDNPMANAFIVRAISGEKLIQLVDTLKQQPWIDQLPNIGDDALNLVSMLDGLRVGGTILMVSLIILTIFLISNTIKLSIYSRQDEIEIMRIVGATNRFIRSPFLVEGILIGLVGSLIPILLVIFGYPYLLSLVPSQRLFNVLQLTASYPLVLNVSLVIALLSVVIGLVGSYLSVSKHLRWVR